jgi:hypothetical protein
MVFGSLGAFCVGSLAVGLPLLLGALVLDLVVETFDA